MRMIQVGDGMKEFDMIAGGVVGFIVAIFFAILIYFGVQLETMQSRIVSDQIVYVGDAMYSCGEVDR